MTEGDNLPAKPVPEDEQAKSLRPEPPTSGSAGTQAPPPGDPTTVITLVQPVSLQSGHVGAVLGELTDARSPAAMALAVAAYRDAEQYRAAVIQKWSDAERDKDHYRQLFYEEKQKTAVLEERQKGRSRLRRIQQVALVVGGLVGGAGISVAIAERGLIGIGGLLTVVGLLVLWLGSPFSGRDE